MKKENSIRYNKIHTLDILRGLCAFGIMFYHYRLFSFHRNITTEMVQDDFLFKIGFYGVSVFYILSGIILYLLYANNLKVIGDVIVFLKRRVWRIYPLFILVTIMTAIPILGFNLKDLSKLFLNVTGLFSILAWDKYIPTGGWSIGNELFFYLFFAFVFFYLKKFFVNSDIYIYIYYLLYCFCSLVFL